MGKGSFWDGLRIASEWFIMLSAKAAQYERRIPWLLLDFRISLSFVVYREELQELDNKRQQTNLIVLCLAMLGLMIALMENELMWHNRNIPVMSFQLIKLFCRYR